MIRKLPRLYLVSFGYTYATRLQSLRALALRLATEHFVVLYVIYFVRFGTNIKWHFVGSILLQGLLGYIVLNSVYEAGYYVNDSVSTRFETRPTMRATDAHGHIRGLLLSRAAWWCIGSFFLTKWDVPLSRLAVASTSLALLFVLHNCLQAGTVARLCSFTGLRVFRYALVPFVLAPQSALPALLIMLPVIVLGLARYAVAKSGSEHAETLRPFTAGALSYSIFQVLFLPLQVALFWQSSLPLLLPNVMISLVGILGSLWRGWATSSAPPLGDGLTPRGLSGLELMVRRHRSTLF